MCKEGKGSLHSILMCTKAVWMPADDDYFCGEACIVTCHNEKNQNQFEVQQRPGGAPVSTDEDEDEDDWRPQAHDEIEDDDPYCVGSPTLEGPPAKRLRRRVTAAPTTAASAASAAPGASGASLRNFFTVAHAPAVASQRRSSTNTTEAARVSTSTAANAQQAHFVRQPAAGTMGATPPVGLGTTRWALTDYSESDNEEVAARASVANVAASRHGAMWWMTLTWVMLEALVRMATMPPKGMLRPLPRPKRRLREARAFGTAT